MSAELSSEYVCACGHEADRHKDGGCIGSFGGPLGQGTFMGCGCRTQYGEQLSIDDALGDLAEAIDDRLAELGRVIPSRDTDPETSHAAAKSVTVKANSQRALLLDAFYRKWNHDGGGLTDDQAMHWAAGVYQHSCYWKRCSELREGGFIEPTGETRAGSAGPQRIVSRITDKGRAWIEANR